MHKQGVVSPAANGANLDLVLRIPTRIAIETVDPAARVQIVDGPFSVYVEDVGFQRDVDISPPDMLG